jgi:hypothetical protein
VLAHLLTWLQNQIAVFASVLARQIQLGASEYADIMFERYADHYRSSNARYSMHSMHRAGSIGGMGGMGGGRESLHGPVGRMSRSESVGMGGRAGAAGLGSGAVGVPRTRRMSVTVNNMLKAASITSSPVMQHQSSMASIAAGGMASVGLAGGLAASKARLGVGPLTFVSDCLQAVFKESVRLDVLGLEGSSSLGWTMLPEIKTLIRNFTNDIIEEVGVQVQEDSWHPFREGRPQARAALWPAGVLYNPAAQSSSKIYTCAVLGLCMCARYRITNIFYEIVLSSLIIILCVLMLLCPMSCVMLLCYLCAGRGGVSRRSLCGDRPSSDGRGRASASAGSPRDRARPSMGGDRTERPSLSPHSPLASAAAAASDDLYLSASYVWVVAVMSEFLAEVWVLLQAGSPDSDTGPGPPPSPGKRGSSSRTPFSRGGGEDKDASYAASPDAGGRAAAHVQYYSRDDVCEIEPEIVSCLLRILVRYVRDVEGSVPVRAEIAEDEDGEDDFEEQALSEAQRECYMKTVEAVKTKLIPALNDVIWSNFFSDGSVLVLNPPKSILDRLSAKVGEMLDTARSTWG